MPTLAFRTVPAPQSNHHQSRIVANQFVYRATEMFFAGACRFVGAVRFAGTSDASKARQDDDGEDAQRVGIEQTLALLVHPTGFEPVTSAFGVQGR